MKLNVLKIISAALLLSLLAGCSSKEETVTYKSEKKEISKKELETKNWNELKSVVEKFGSEKAMEKLNKAFKK